jgi:hypothetical protein
MRKQLTYKDVESSDDYYFICGGKQKGSLSYYVDQNHLFCDKFGKKSKKKYFRFYSNWKSLNLLPIKFKYPYPVSG